MDTFSYPLVEIQIRHCKLVYCVCACLSVCMHSCLRVCMCLCSVCNHSMNNFSQLIGLSIEGHNISLHMDAAGLTAAHPANRSAIEGRPAANVMLVHHCWFRLRFGRLSFRQLEFQELIGLLEATKWHGAPNKTRWESYYSPFCQKAPTKSGLKQCTCWSISTWVSP